MSHDGSHDKCGKVVHRPCSSCISNIGKSNKDSIKFSLSITEQRTVSFIPAWSLATLHRSVKTALLGYFGHNGYKLLDKTTDIVFKSQDVISEERTTHIMRQPTLAVLYDDNDPFIYNSLPNNNAASSDNNASTNQIPLSIQGIAPRPLASCDLHKNIQRTLTDNNSTAVMEKEQDKELSKVSETQPLALRKSQRTARPST